MPIDSSVVRRDGRVFAIEHPEPVEAGQLGFDTSLEAPMDPRGVADAYIRQVAPEFGLSSSVVDGEAGLEGPAVGTRLAYEGTRTVGGSVVVSLGR